MMLIHHLTNHSLNIGSTNISSFEISKSIKLQKQKIKLQPYIQQ